MKNGIGAIIKFILLLLLPTGNGSIYGQVPLDFKHITVENGLSSGSVLSLAQDDKGFLWVGTMDGLNRYDGKRIKVYKSFYGNNPIGSGIKIAQLLTDKKQNLWIGTQNGLYVYNNRLDSFRVFYHSDRDINSICSNDIKALFMDSDENIWVGTSNGLCKLERGSDFRFQPVQLSNKNENQRFNDVYSVFQSSSGLILVGTANGIVFLSEQKQNGIKNYSASVALRNITIRSIAEDKAKAIWVGTHGNGLFKLNEKGDVEKHYTHQVNQKNGLVSNTIRKLKVDRQGVLWIGTLEGLNLFHESSEYFETYVQQPDDSKTLNFNSIYDVFEDRQGIMWIATFFGGLNYAELIKTPFVIYQSKNDETGLSSNVIQPIIGDEKNNLWIGTEAEGLNYFDRQKGVFKRFKRNGTLVNSLSSNLVKALTMDNKNRIWVGTTDGYIDVIDHSGKKLFQFSTKDSDAVYLTDNVMDILKDSQNRIWIGSQESGIRIYDIKRNKLEKFEVVYPGKQLSSKNINCLFEDSKKNVWIGTGHGLSLLQFVGNSVSVENFRQKNYSDQLQSDFINCIAEDKKGMIWFGTYSGLSCYDPVKKVFSTYTVKDGLIDNKVVGIVVDNNDNLWVSTGNGISRISISRTQFYSYNTNDGLPGNVFNYRSAYKDKKGHVFFGGYKGMIEFVPDEIQINEYSPRIILTGLQINKNPVNPNDNSKVLFRNIYETDNIDLRYDQSTLTIDYAVMNFIKPAKNRSAYRLEGVNMDWIYTDAHSASFINLPPGKYKLLIKGCNNDGIWSTAQPILQIRIFPPLWKSWWAYTLYVLLISVITAAIIFFFNSRIALKRKFEYEHMMYLKQQELHQSKMKFFTHISHEIRTPLTLIIGPVDRMRRLFTGNEKVEKMLNTIRVNAEQLLKLTNDLMDFRKADAGHTQLKIEEADIVALAKSVYEKFNEEAIRKSVDFQFNTTNESILAWYDTYHLEIVLTNLLSNAFKFIPESGKISLTLEKNGNESLYIKVLDNGIGIPLASQQKIFTEFYQAETGSVKNMGSGIGLAFSKMLIELHKGKLKFVSGINPETGKMETCFSITLLLGKEHFNGEDITTVSVD